MGLILEIFRRVFLAIAFLIAAIYASAALWGACIAVGEAVIYTKCLFSTGFDFQYADIIFDVLTRDFRRSPRDFFIIGTIFIGLPAGLWGGWHYHHKRCKSFQIYVAT